MQGLHADVKDVAFVYEGRVSGVPPGETPEGLERSGEPGNLAMTYQGEFVTRSDGARRHDIFETQHNRKRPYDVRQVMVELKDKCQAVSQFPDRRNEQPHRSCELNFPGSADRILYRWFFRDLNDPLSRGYEYLGWETIDGHRCLKVQFDEVVGIPENMEDRPTIVFWIDLERGGHPLRVEFRRGGKVRMQVVDIQLARIPFGKGREAWLPVHGRHEDFLIIGPETPTRAVGFETYTVVDGSIRINHNPGDEVFTIDWKGTATGDQSLARRQREFRKPPRRTDPEGIRCHLAKALAEADEDDRRLEASSPARETWTPTLVWQAVLTLTGVFALGAAGTWKWTHR